MNHNKLIKILNHIVAVMPLYWILIGMAISYFIEFEWAFIIWGICAVSIQLVCIVVVRKLNDI